MTQSSSDTFLASIGVPSSHPSASTMTELWSRIGHELEKVEYTANTVRELRGSGPAGRTDISRIYENTLIERMAQVNSSIKELRRLSDKNCLPLVLQHTLGQLGKYRQADRVMTIDTLKDALSSSIEQAALLFGEVLSLSDQLEDFVSKQYVIDLRQASLPLYPALQFGEDTANQYGACDDGTVEVFRPDLPLSVTFKDECQQALSNLMAVSDFCNARDKSAGLTSSATPAIPDDQAELWASIQPILSKIAARHIALEIIQDNRLRPQATAVFV